MKKIKSVNDKKKGKKKSKHKRYCSENVEAYDGGRGDTIVFVYNHKRNLVDITILSENKYIATGKQPTTAWTTTLTQKDRNIIYIKKETGKRRSIQTQNER